MNRILSMAFVLIHWNLQEDFLHTPKLWDWHIMSDFRRLITGSCKKGRECSMLKAKFTSYKVAVKYHLSCQECSFFGDIWLNNWQLLWKNVSPSWCKFWVSGAKSCVVTPGYSQGNCTLPNYSVIHSRICSHDCSPFCSQVEYFFTLVLVLFWRKHKNKIEAKWDNGNAKALFIRPSPLWLLRVGTACYIFSH